MKKIISFIIVLSGLAAMSFTQSANDEGKGECFIMHEGTFKYGNPGEEIRVEIKGKSHMEYHQDGKYIIKSKLTWVNDCEYNTELIKTTIPDFPYEKGAVMNVKINKVEGKYIYYTSTIKGESWPGKFTKVK